MAKTPEQKKATRDAAKANLAWGIGYFFLGLSLIVATGFLLPKVIELVTTGIGKDLPGWFKAPQWIVAIGIIGICAVAIVWVVTQLAKLSGDDVPAIAWIAFFLAIALAVFIGINLVQNGTITINGLPTPTSTATANPTPIPSPATGATGAPSSGTPWSSLPGTPNPAPTASPAPGGTKVP